MVDQLTALERVATTPIPISCEQEPSTRDYGTERSRLFVIRWNPSEAMCHRIPFRPAVHSCTLDAVRITTNLPLFGSLRSPLQIALTVAGI